MTGFLDSFDAAFQRYKGAMESLFGPDWRQHKLTREDKVKLTWKANRHRFFHDVRRYGGNPVTYILPEDPYKYSPASDPSKLALAMTETFTFTYRATHDGDPDHATRYRTPIYTVTCDGVEIERGVRQ